MLFRPASPHRLRGANRTAAVMWSPRDPAAAVGAEESVQRQARSANRFCLNSPIGDHFSLAWVGVSILRASELLGNAPVLQPHSNVRRSEFPATVDAALLRYRRQPKQSTPTVERSLTFGRYAHHELAVRARRHDVLVFWDSDTLTDSMAARLRQFDYVYGISRFVANVIAERIGREVWVFHHGVWPELSPYSPPPADGPFTFLHMGTVNPRKATDLLFRAFALAFPAARRDDVRLVVKCDGGSVAQAIAWRREFAADDPRIVIDGQHVARRDLSQYFAQAHAVALPSRCEGFGLVGLEALAHGRTVIASDWSGPGDYLAAEDCFVVPAERPVAAYGYPGLAREIELDTLVEALRSVAANPDRAEVHGRTARARVLRDWTWAGKCQAYLANSGQGVAA